ncbi:MAG: ribonuclease J [Lachnospiraceae bacterium]|nr:ribonuclease J [Lachnospiraceae bacterium]
MVQKFKSDKPAVKIVPLGGLEQIGMNITAIEYDDTIIVIDCGVAFPEDDMLGIDLVVPDVTYLTDNIDKVKAFVITHGHEDHIGALPYILPKIPVPVYATRLTVGLIENKFKEFEVPKKVKFKTVVYGQSVVFGKIRVEFIRTNHSIADAAALAIHTPAGVIVHTGDFKIDYTPVYGETVDLARFAELGKKGVLALICDSTNVLRPGYTMSEKTVGKTFDSLFAEHNSRRIIVATFASNVDRVQQIINSAEKFGRKVVIEGRSMVNVIKTASELGYLKFNDDTIIPIENLRSYPEEKTVIITTGSQGESMAALSRIASNIHKKISIQPGDIVIFSSSPIPGNEKSISKVINELSMKGAKVIYQDAHVSGHACQEEIKLMYTLTKPRYAIPVHGEYRHLQAHSELCQSLGIPKDNIFILRCGDCLTLNDESALITHNVPAGSLFVDGLGVGDVGNVVLRDRHMLSENGLIVVAMSIESETGLVVSGPDIITRGFVYVRESEVLLAELTEVCNKTLDYCIENRLSDWGKIKNRFKDDLSDYLWKKMRRSPMILPIIMEV